MQVADALMWADVWSKTGEGDGNSEALSVLSSEVRRLLTLAEDAHEAWDNDRDTKVGKLLYAMISPEFCQHYRPELSPNAELKGSR